MKEKEYLELYYKEDSIELKDILNLIFKGKFIILAATIICTAAALWYATSKPVTYTTKAEFAQQGGIFMAGDKIAKSYEFNENLAKNDTLKTLYSESNKGKEASKENITDWAKSMVTVKAEELNTTVNDYVRKITFTATGSSEKQVVDLINAYKNTMDLTMTQEKTRYYDDRIKELDKKLEILKDMKASETSYSFTVDEISRMKLEKESAKLLTPVGSLDKIDEIVPSKKKYGVMGLAGGVILGLAIVFGWDFLKNVK